MGYGGHGKGGGDRYGDRDKGKGGKGKFNGGGKGKGKGGKGKKGQKGPPDRRPISQEEIRATNYTDCRKLETPRQAQIVKIPVRMQDADDDAKPAVKECRDYAERPGVGKRGRECGVLINMFRVAFPSEDYTLMQLYDFAIFGVRKPREPREGDADRPKKTDSEEHLGSKCPDKDESPDKPPREPVDLIKVLKQEGKGDVLRKIFEAFWKEVGSDFQGHVSYDGGKIFYTSPFKFSDEEDKDGTVREVVINDNGKDRTFKVVAKHKIALSTKLLDDFYKECQARTGTREEPLQLITAFEICLKHHLVQHLGLVDAGRRFFPSPGSSGRRAVDLGGGLELWQGFVQSIRVCQSGLYLNLDRCSSAFWEECALPVLLKKFINCPLERLDRGKIHMLNKEFKGLKIDQTHTTNKRRWKIKEISSKNASQERFTDKEGNEHTVASYFESKYGRLKYPDYPLICVKTKPVVLYLPMEHCFVAPNQRLMKLLGDTQIAEAIKTASVDPAVHSRSVKEYIENAKYDPRDVHGIQIDMKMLECKARTIEAPKLAYVTMKRGYDRDSKTAESSISPDGGSWNMRDKKVIVGGKLNCWGVLSLIDPSQGRCDFRMEEIKQFVTELVRNIGDQMGIEVGMKRPPIMVKHDSDTIAAAYEKTAQAAYFDPQNTNKGPPQLVIVIKETSNKDEYRDVKKASDSNCGVPSQCVLVKHLWGGGNPMYLANVGLKINQKIGGQNTAIAGTLPPIGLDGEGGPLNSQPIMVIGADVTHFPREGGKPSIAAMVGTVDNRLVKFVSTLRYQHHVTETLECVGEMVVDLVEQFRSQNNILPARLVIYRDGVASSQFPAILGTEVTQVKEALAKIKCETTYEPKISYIVLQKSHNIRFFPKSDNGDRSGNVKSGTVIDTDITHPYEHDFFLMSQSGLKGTSKPSRYIVLKDENNFSADAIQHFTYWQCYTFGRATKAVSCVPSIYYAHLLAFRARHMLYEDFDDTATVSSNSDGMKPWPGYAYTNFHEQIVGQMFYV